MSDGKTIQQEVQGALRYLLGKVEDGAYGVGDDFMEEPFLEDFDEQVTDEIF